MNGGASSASGGNACWCEFYLVKFKANHKNEVAYAIKCGVKSTDFSDGFGRCLLSEMSNTLQTISGAVASTELLKHTGIYINNNTNNTDGTYIDIAKVQVGTRSYLQFDTRIKGIDKQIAQVVRRLTPQAHNPTLSINLLNNKNKVAKGVLTEIKNTIGFTMPQAGYEHDEMKDIEKDMQRKGTEGFRFGIHPDWYYLPRWIHLHGFYKDVYNHADDYHKAYIKPFRQSPHIKVANGLTSALEFFAHYMIYSHFIKLIPVMTTASDTWFRCGMNSVLVMNFVKDNEWIKDVNKSWSDYRHSLTDINPNGIGKYELFIFRFANGKDDDARATKIYNDILTEIRNNVKSFFDNFQRVTTNPTPTNYFLGFPSINGTAFNTPTFHTAKKVSNWYVSKDTAFNFVIGSQTNDNKTNNGFLEDAPAFKSMNYDIIKYWNDAIKYAKNNPNANGGWDYIINYYNTLAATISPQSLTLT